MILIWLLLAAYILFDCGITIQGAFGVLSFNPLFKVIFLKRRWIFFGSKERYGIMLMKEMIDLMKKMHDESGK